MRKFHKAIVLGVLAGSTGLLLFHGRFKAQEENPNVYLNDGRDVQDYYKIEPDGTVLGASSDFYYQFRMPQELLETVNQIISSNEFRDLNGFYFHGQQPQDSAVWSRITAPGCKMAYYNDWNPPASAERLFEVLKAPEFLAAKEAGKTKDTSKAELLRFEVAGTFKYTRITCCKMYPD